MVLLTISACSLVRVQAQTQRATRLLPLKVAGTQLVDDMGRRVRLQGVNVPSLEWSPNGEGHIAEAVREAVQNWHANLIRLPLSQDRWFGKTSEQQDGGAAYRALVQKIVDYAAAHSAYIILDLHWSDVGLWGQRIAQHNMPDANSVAFWKEVAVAYKNNPAVLFDLYNEPHDVSWDIWRNGGQVTETSDKEPAVSYRAVGLQQLLDVVRATGANNVIVAGGLGFSSDYTGILAGNALADPKGRGVIYADHYYPFKGETVEAWTKRLETASQKIPIYVGEFGSEPGGGVSHTGEQWVRHVLQVVNDHNWNYTAWSFHPSAKPSLIGDWDYKPTAHFGTWVQQALAGKLARYTPPDPALYVAPALADGKVYADGLLNGWQNYGWAKMDYANTTPVHAGNASIRVQAGPFEAMYLHHDPFRVGNTRNLTFWIHGGTTGGQALKVQATIGGKPQLEFTLPKPYPNAWRLVVVPLAGLNVTAKTNIDGFWIQNLSGSAAPLFYVDDIAFTP